jgi:hypothetical protein
MQFELTQPGNLLDVNGKLAQVGWSRQPLLDCNLENARFYSLRALQFLRIKRWDYYALFTPDLFFSATIADLGYAGNIFVYVMDLKSADLHEESLVIPLAKGLHLPRNSTSGTNEFKNEKVKLTFRVLPDERQLSVVWAGFHDGLGIEADIRLACQIEFESMNIVIPIGSNRFYYNRKINALPATGTIKYGSNVIQLDLKTCLGSLDWGRGVWDYESYWNWASASGFLPDGRTIGLNFGNGFGDLSRAGENAIILDHKVHKLGPVAFEYISGDYMKPWQFKDQESRLDLNFTPFRDRTARTNLAVITSEVHQMFGHYNRTAIMDTGERIQIHDLIGFAEEHRAKW